MFISVSLPIIDLRLFYNYDTNRLPILNGFDEIGYRLFLRSFGAIKKRHTLNPRMPYYERSFFSADNALKFDKLRYHKFNSFRFVPKVVFRRVFVSDFTFRVDIGVKDSFIRYEKELISFPDGKSYTIRRRGKISEYCLIRSIFHILSNKTIVKHITSISNELSCDDTDETFYDEYYKDNHCRLIKSHKDLSKLILYSTTAKPKENDAAIKDTCLIPSTPFVVLEVFEEEIDENELGMFIPVRTEELDYWNIKLFYRNLCYRDSVSFNCWLLVKNCRTELDKFRNLRIYLLKTQQERLALKEVVKAIYSNVINISNANQEYINHFLNEALSILTRKKYYGYDNFHFQSVMNEIDNQINEDEIQFLIGKIESIETLGHFIGRLHYMSKIRYDLFVSHASDDKSTFVGPFVDELEKLGLSVWYDKSAIRIGDSLRQKIDAGIATSKHSVVVFSNKYFAKSWPTAELDALFSLERMYNKRILPIFHNVDEKYVAKMSPLMSGKLAIKTCDYTIPEIARMIYDSIK